MQLGIVAPPVKFVTSLYYSTVSGENISTSREVIIKLSNLIMTVIVAYEQLCGCMCVCVCIYLVYMHLKIKPDSVRIRSLSCQFFVLPLTGFELTPLIHCSTNHLAVCPAYQTTRPYPLKKYSFNSRSVTFSHIYI